MEADHREIPDGADGVAVSKMRTGRLRAIAAVLEKVTIVVAMALLTYALIAVDTRAATASVPAGSSGCAVQGIPVGVLVPWGGLA